MNYKLTITLSFIIVLSQSCGFSESYNRKQLSNISDEILILTVNSYKKYSLGLPHERMQYRLAQEEIKRRGLRGSGSILSKISPSYN